MSSEIVIVLGILIAAIILFVTDKYGPDIVALLVVLSLLLSGTLNITDALAGFANPAVITIAAIFMITAGLTNTGVAAWIGRYLFRIAGKNEARLVAVTMGASAILSLVMNNIASASVLLAQILSSAAAMVLIAPIALSTATQLHVSGYPVIMMIVLGTSSGFLTPVSHPVNVLVMGPGGYKFGDYARVGICLTAIVFTLVMVLVPFFWPL